MLAVKYFVCFVAFDVCQQEIPHPGIDQVLLYHETVVVSTGDHDSFCMWNPALELSDNRLEIGDPDLPVKSIISGFLLCCVGV